MRAWLPRDDDRIRVIYNALPREITPWRGSGDNGKKHLLFVGRISDKKGPLTLVEALASAGGKNWVLDILGDGPLRAKLESRITELGLEDKIRLRGFCNDISEAFATSDLFLFPSMDEEGYSLTLAEAFASGIPVMASDISTTREITDGDDGRSNPELLPVGDAGAWSGALKRFLDGEYIPSLKIAVKQPTAEEMVESTLRFYGERLRCT
jgi:glycosyltransferase involved in cell wall biosynthesis